MFCFSSAQITYIYPNSQPSIRCSVRLSARSKEQLALCSPKKLKILNTFSGLNFVQKENEPQHVLSLSFLGLYLFKTTLYKFMFCLSLFSQRLRNPRNQLLSKILRQSLHVLSLSHPEIYLFKDQSESIMFCLSLCSLNRTACALFFQSPRNPQKPQSLLWNRLFKTTGIPVHVLSLSPLVIYI